MDRDLLLSIARESLQSVSVPRFFDSERGHQGALLGELSKRLPQDFLHEGVVVEQEYQKRLAAHGTKIRPDVVIHEPFNAARHTDRRTGNIAVIELKLRASNADAEADYKDLVMMIDVLRYPLGLFVNIASEVTYAELIPPDAKGRVVAFAVSLRDGRVHVVEART